LCKIKTEVPEAAKRPRAVLLFAAKNILLGLSNNHDLFCSFPGSEVTKGVEDSIAGTGRLREEASILGEHQYLLAGDG
jgi:hypothetical protein